MAEALKLVTATEAGQARIIEQLEKTLKQARDGEIAGLLILIEGQKDFSYSRTNMSLETGLGITTRVLYKLNREWDNA